MKKSDLFFAFILLPVDIAMIIVAFILAYYLRMGLEVIPAFSDIGIKEYLRYSVYLMPLWIAMNALNGLYHIKTNRSLFIELYRIINASSTAMIFLVVAIFLTKTMFFSRLILVFTWIISIITIFFGRLIIKLIQQYLLKFGIGQSNVILIGDNSTSESIVMHLSASNNKTYKICGVLNGESRDSKFGLKILGSIDELEKKIKQYKINEVVLTDISLSKSKIMNLIQVCSDYKITFKYIPDTFSLMTLNVSSETIGSMPVMELKSIPLDGWGRIVKRIIDIFFASAGFIILFPIMVIIGILVKLTSKGPVLYAHERVGRDEQIFKFYKFRSMYIEKCDFKGGVYWTRKADDNTRVTPFGKFIRKTNLDELPQLWNIIRGDMSLVGPRPELPKHVKRFENEIPDYFRRHKVKVGLTGWAQVNGLKGDTSIKERVRYDIYYIENWSLWFDIKIMIKTIFLIIDEIITGKSEYRSRP